ncbi:hypothetical protein QAD02_016487 [Eretmocerus hayati]|uniref:Uncharacterized protein n=1 Tax=Eretmocerus hayati TaxID=131215 RepID=A0ACC2PG06_9HYME|nr:hypothetical protein QAD02_016487 [Eretmocerus hayati]
MSIGVKNSIKKCSPDQTKNATTLDPMDAGNPDIGAVIHFYADAVVAVAVVNRCPHCGCCGQLQPEQVARSTATPACLDATRRTSPTQAPSILVEIPNTLKSIVRSVSG